MSQRVLSFDIGIKNLAWCLMDSNGQVVDWCNYNILEDISGTITETNKCRCGAKASWEHIRDGRMGYTCKRHLPIDRPAYESPSKSAADFPQLLQLLR